MAIAIVREFPAEAAQFYDAFIAGLNLDTDRPAGFVIHAAGMYDGRWREVELWESREAYDAFLRERVAPLMQRMFGGEMPPTAPEIMETRNVIA